MVYLGDGGTVPHTDLALSSPSLRDTPVARHPLVIGA